MSKKYYDTTSALQVIGCVFKNPKILESTDKYVLTDADFLEKLHLITYGTIYQLYESGASKISLKNILDFLAQHPKSEAIFKKEKGEEWLLQVVENASETAFDYYYNRLKKMTLLRAFDDHGINVSHLYDPDNILDTKKKQIQEEWLDNTSLADIANKVIEEVDQIVSTHVSQTFGEVQKPDDGAWELREKLRQRPDVGIPLYGPLINTVTRGARLRKLYLRSAPSGYGKTRTMVADVCYIGCDEIYDEMFGWIKNGTAEPVLYITTEQELEEIQTMMWAFISGVDEDHIMNNRYEGDEEERVDKAIEILARSKIFIIELPDFSLRDVENLIKQNIRENQVKYVVNPKGLKACVTLFL